METFIDAAHRLASSCVTKIELGEVEPIAFLRNRWTLGADESIHLGIAFAARVRNQNPERLLKETLHSRGQFVPYNDTSVPFSLPHNEEVAGLARKYLSGLSLNDVPEHEIAENLEYAGRYKLHGRFGKPLFRALGRCKLLRR